MKMFKINMLKLVILCLYVGSLHAYIFSSHYAEHLLSIKMKMQQKFEATMNTFDYLHKNLNRYTNDLQRLLEVSASYTEIEEFVSNPIYAFKLVKLLTKDFDQLQNKFRGKNALEFSNIIETIKSDNPSFPTIQDLNGICQAITRLQDIYEINEETILNGNFQNYWNGSLAEHDLKELRRCYQYHKHFDVYEWFSSEMYYDDNTAEGLLLEYYKALNTFSKVTRLSTQQVLNDISDIYFGN